jgi:hypothetical protein
MHTSIATAHPDTVTPVAAARLRADTWLRTVLTVNATTSIGGGALATVAASRVDSLLGTGSPGWVRLVGVGLVAFGCAVLALARGPRARRVQLTPLVSALDAGWVVGTAAAIAAGWFSTRGAWVMAGLAALIVDLALVQMWAVRRSRR